MLTEIEELMAEYIAAISEGSVSDDLRGRIRSEIGSSYEKAMEVTDVIVLIAKTRLRDGMYSISEAENFCREEYRALGLGEIAMYKYIAPAVNLFIGKVEFIAMTDEERLRVLQSAFEGNSNTDRAELKRAMYIFLLKMLLKYRLAVQDPELTKSLSEIIAGYTPEQKESAILPRTIMDDT